MKILGIDYGTKRIGLAISDEGMEFAFPSKILPNDSKAFEEISKVLKEEKIFEIVIGDTLSETGRENSATLGVESFIEEMGHKFKLPIKREKEFYTSVEARGRAGKESLSARQVKSRISGYVDASAAALILQRFLDRRNKQKE